MDLDYRLAASNQD